MHDGKARTKPPSAVWIAAKKMVAGELVDLARNKAASMGGHLHLPAV
jgi:hypothetical protein